MSRWNRVAVRSSNSLGARCDPTASAISAYQREMLDAGPPRVRSHVAAASAPAVAADEPARLAVVGAARGSHGPCAIETRVRLMSAIPLSPVVGPASARAVHA